MIKLTIEITPVEISPNKECNECELPASFMIKASLDDDGTKITHIIHECSQHAAEEQTYLEQLIEGYSSSVEFENDVRRG